MLFFLALIACTGESTPSIETETVHPQPTNVTTNQAAEVKISTKAGSCDDGVMTEITVTATGGDISLWKLKLKNEVKPGPTIEFDVPSRSDRSRTVRDWWEHQPLKPRVLGPRNEHHNIYITGNETIRLVSGDTCSPHPAPIEWVEYNDENTRKSVRMSLK